MQHLEKHLAVYAQFVFIIIYIVFSIQLPIITAEKYPLVLTDLLHLLKDRNHPVMAGYGPELECPSCLANLEPYIFISLEKTHYILLLSKIVHEK